MLQGSFQLKCEELRAIRDVLCSRPPGTNRTDFWSQQTAYSDLYGTQSIAVVCCWFRDVDLPYNSIAWGR